MTTRDELTVLALVACDYSYNPNPAINDVLSTYRDSEPEDDYIPPNHLFTNVGIEPGSGPVGQFKNEVLITGWSVADKYADPSTGFSFVIFQNIAKTEAIVALTGTNGLDAQDWYTDLNLGTTQWNSDNRLALANMLQALQGPDNSSFTGTIHFTGQSLGGALAQYAAYDYAKSKVDAGLPVPTDKITLTTFNGLGAKDGIKEMYGSPDAALMAGVSTRHYVTGNDIVHRLGGGHVNGGNTLLLDFKTWVEGTPVLDEFNNEVGMAAGGWRYPNLFDAHRIETGFYRWFGELGTDFSYAQPHSIDYIGDDLVLVAGRGTDRVSVQGWFVDPAARLEVRFDDGTVWSADELEAHIAGPSDLADYVVGTGGADVLEGFGGDDALEGREGDDTYVYATGDGNDTIIDTAGVNTLQLNGIAPDAVVLETDGTDVFVKVGAGGTANDGQWRAAA